MKISSSLSTTLAFALCATALPAFATEGPVGAPNGADGFFAGALPPAGTYNLAFGLYYTANRVNDSNGNSELPNFSVSKRIFADKVLHMTDAHFLGGQVGFYGAAALAAVNLQVQPGLTATKTGLLDPEGGVIVAWHTPEFHYYGLATVVVPFGSYDKTALINLTNNYTTFRPQFGFSYLPSYGLDLSARMTYSFNSTNKATDYKTGQWFHSDFNAGYALGAGWKAGLQGYYLHQTTDDKQNGARVGDGNRLNVLALGPGVFYQINQGSFIEFKYLTEMNAKNTTQGEALWVKSVITF